MQAHINKYFLRTHTRFTAHERTNILTQCPTGMAVHVRSRGFVKGRLTGAQAFSLGWTRMKER